MGRPTRAIRLTNGMLLVFDERGNQLAKYQGVARIKAPQLSAQFPDVPIEEMTWQEFMQSRRGE